MVLCFFSVTHKFLNPANKNTHKNIMDLDFLDILWWQRSFTCQLKLARAWDRHTERVKPGVASVVCGVKLACVLWVLTGFVMTIPLISAISLLCVLLFLLCDVLQWFIYTACNSVAFAQHCLIACSVAVMFCSSWDCSTVADNRSLQPCGVAKLQEFHVTCDLCLLCIYAKPFCFKTNVSRMCCVSNIFDSHSCLQ